MSDGPAPLGDRPPAFEARSDDAVAALEARLGVPLADRGVALAALTHKSYVNEHRDEEGLADNERLEFLGDAVIDLAVSHRLMEQFPTAREGDLSKMRAAVVDEQGLSEMARVLDIGPLLRLGRGEELTGGRQKASLLADAMEAVIAAVFIGGGLVAVLRIVDRFLGEAFARAAAGTLDRDYKTQLQELAQSRLRATPRYRVVAEHGPDHSKTFEVETDLRGEVVGRGTGRSKKDAEQAAARLALDALGRRFAPATLEVASGAQPPGSAPAACEVAVALPGPAPAEPLAMPAPASEVSPPSPADAARPDEPAAAPADGERAPEPEPAPAAPRRTRAPRAAARKSRRAAPARKKAPARKGRRGKGKA
jgi:ribonuclease-3